MHVKRKQVQLSFGHSTSLQATTPQLDLMHNSLTNNNKETLMPKTLKNIALTLAMLLSALAALCMPLK